ncbi:hypothetical protein QOT17_000909 [Balamuthia mandrillaris]
MEGKQQELINDDSPVTTGRWSPLPHSYHKLNRKIRATAEENNKATTKRYLRFVPTFLRKSFFFRRRRRLSKKQRLLQAALCFCLLFCLLPLWLYQTAASISWLLSSVSGFPFGGFNDEATLASFALSFRPFVQHAASKLYRNHTGTCWSDSGADPSALGWSLSESAIQGTTIQHIAETLEPFSLPGMLTIYSPFVKDLLRTIQKFSPAGLIFRRANLSVSPHLSRNLEHMFTVESSLTKTQGYLESGLKVVHSHKFEDGTEQPGFLIGGNHIRFRYLSTQYTTFVDSSMKTYWISHNEAKKVVVSSKTSLEAGEHGEVATLRYDFVFAAGKQYVRIDITLVTSSDLRERLTDVELSFSVDSLSRVENKDRHYKRFFWYNTGDQYGDATRAGNSYQVLYNVARNRNVPLKWYSIMEDGHPSRSFSIETILDTPEYLKEVVTSGGPSDGSNRFHWVENWYSLGNVERSSKRRISEKRLLLAGSARTSRPSYDRVFSNIDCFDEIDLSVSTDYGSKVFGVAALYNAEAKRGRGTSSTSQASSTTLMTEKIAFTREWKEWIDLNIQVYYNDFVFATTVEGTKGGRRVYAEAQSRGIANLLLACEKMYEATREQQYKDTISSLADSLLKFQILFPKETVKDTKNEQKEKEEEDELLEEDMVLVTEGTFGCYSGARRIESLRFECHVSSMLALAKAYRVLRKPLYLERLAKALTAIHVDLFEEVKTGTDGFILNIPGTASILRGNKYLSAVLPHPEADEENHAERIRRIISRSNLHHLSKQLPFLSSLNQDYNHDNIDENNQRLLDIDPILLGNLIFVRSSSFGSSGGRDTIFLAAKAGLCVRTMNYLLWLHEQEGGVGRGSSSNVLQRELEYISILRHGCLSYLRECISERDEASGGRAVQKTWRDFTEANADSQIFGLLGLVPAYLYN